MEIVIEQAYLNDLKRSTIVNNRLLLQAEMDFTKSKYTGQETIAEILQEYGVELDEDLLSEGMFSVPINKLKNMVMSVGKDVGNLEGLKNIKKKFGGMASKVTNDTMKQKAVQIAATKNIDEKEVASIFDMVARAMSAYSFGGFVIGSPFGWLLIIVALLKAKDFESFKKNISDAITDLGKSITKTGTEFEEAMDLYAWAYKLVMICFIPPWIQAIVLMPLAGVYAFIGLILMSLKFLDYFGG